MLDARLMELWFFIYICDSFFFGHVVFPLNHLMVGFLIVVAILWITLNIGVVIFVCYLVIYL